MRIGKSERPVPPRAAGRRAVDHRQPAAQRHRLAAHRPRARQHAAGHPHPPRADAGQGRLVGGRHRPCRHRHPDGGRAPARGSGRTSAPTTAARSSSPRSGSGRRRAAAQITRQLRRLGCSMDWANERFTMDEGFTRAVLKVFVELYREGLLYRDKRLVNWDPKFQTGDQRPRGRDARGAGQVLAPELSARRRQRRTSRSRPRGPRRCSPTWRSRCTPTTSATATLVGKQVRLPITGRLIPIVADEHADPELGSGAVKITPGHDFNDFEVGKRAGIQAGATCSTCSMAQARIVPDRRTG